jgi:hypothetical protein
VWEKPDEDGRGSGIYHFTGLMGTDKKILLEKLPSKLDGVVTPATCDTVIRLWKVQYSHKVYFYARRFSFAVLCLQSKTVESLGRYLPWSR